VYANDVIREARSFAEGFALDDVSVGAEDIVDIGPGGTFLSSERTFRLFRDAYTQSDVLPHLTLERWRERGKPRAEDALRRYTAEMIADLEAPEDYDDLMARGEGFINDLGLG
jgi:trimethylamine:corrinoid methyltransferase-like protein